MFNYVFWNKIQYIVLEPYQGLNRHLGDAYK